MKTPRIAAAALSLLVLTGCAGGFGSVKNPVTKSDLDTANLDYRVVLRSAVIYRDLCDRQAMPREKCAPVVAKLDEANQKVLVARRAFTKFVIDHPTIDAASLVTAFKDAVSDFKSIADSNGVK